MRSVFFILVLLGCQTNLVSGQPELRALRESQNPTLVRGRSFDPAFTPPCEADQEKAAAAYESFLKTNPENELAPYLYYHLGMVFTGFAGAAPEECGYIVDKKRAFRYFKLSVEHHPKGKLSWLLCRSRVNAVSLIEPREERVKKYLEFYGWLRGLDRKTVNDQLLLPDRFSPQQTKLAVDTFLKNRDKMLTVAQHNMIAIAGSLSVPARSKALKSIVQEFPGTELEQMAQGRLAAK